MRDAGWQSSAANLLRSNVTIGSIVTVGRISRAGGTSGARCDQVLVIVVPSDEDGLRRTFADAHRRYTGFINARHRWTGHLWQGRFGAVMMDEQHLAHAMRYVSLNPVCARLGDRAEDWRWSSVRAHLAGRDDALVSVAPAIERYGDFAAFLGGCRLCRLAVAQAGGDDRTTLGRFRLGVAARGGDRPNARAAKARAEAGSLVHLVNCYRNRKTATVIASLLMLSGASVRTRGPARRNQDTCGRRTRGRSGIALQLPQASTGCPDTLR